MEHRELEDREGRKALARERCDPAASPGQAGVPVYGLGHASVSESRGPH